LEGHATAQRRQGAQGNAEDTTTYYITNKGYTRSRSHCQLLHCQLPTGTCYSTKYTINNTQPRHNPAYSTVLRGPTSDRPTHLLFYSLQSYTAHSTPTDRQRKGHSTSHIAFRDSSQNTQYADIQYRPSILANRWEPMAPPEKPLAM